jgi:hypothetical protein
MSTLVEFRSRFPQFVGVPDLVIQQAIDDSFLMWSPELPNYGAIISYQAAHQITVQSEAMALDAERVRGANANRSTTGSGYRSTGTSKPGTLRSISPDVSDTQFSREVARLVAPYCGGGLGII